jgi:hypothetical protein
VGTLPADSVCMAVLKVQTGRGRIFSGSECSSAAWPTAAPGPDRVLQRREGGGRSGSGLSCYDIRLRRRLAREYRVRDFRPDAGVFGQPYGGWSYSARSIPVFWRSPGGEASALPAMPYRRRLPVLVIPRCGLVRAFRHRRCGIACRQQRRLFSAVLQCGAGHRREWRGRSTRLPRTVAQRGRG